MHAFMSHICRSSGYHPKQIVKRDINSTSHVKIFSSWLITHYDTSGSCSAGGVDSRSVRRNQIGHLPVMQRRSLRSTLYHGSSDRVERVKSQRNQQHLSTKEKELIQWITQLTGTGHLSRHVTIREMAIQLQPRHVKQINDDSVIHISYSAIAK